MTYKILILISNNATGQYWSFLQVNNADYSTADLTVLKSKALELLQTHNEKEIKIVTEHSFLTDLTIS